MFLDIARTINVPTAIIWIAVSVVLIAGVVCALIIKKKNVK